MKTYRVKTADFDKTVKANSPADAARQCAGAEVKLGKGSDNHKVWVYQSDNGFFYTVIEETT